MTEAYIHGFLTKCAEHGLTKESAAVLLKFAANPTTMYYGAGGSPRPNMQSAGNLPKGYQNTGTHFTGKTYGMGGPAGGLQTTFTTNNTVANPNSSFPPEYSIGMRTGGGSYDERGTYFGSDPQKAQEAINYQNDVRQMQSHAHEEMNYLNSDAGSPRWNAMNGAGTGPNEDPSVQQL